MPRPLSLLTGALTLSALLTGGVAHAASGPCPEAADIVRSVYQNQDKPDREGRIRLKPVSYTHLTLPTKA